MIELAFDIASGATFKFNTAFAGQQVRLSLRRSYIPGQPDGGWYCTSQCCRAPLRLLGRSLLLSYGSKTVWLFTAVCPHVPVTGGDHIFSLIGVQQALTYCPMPMQEK